MMLLKIGEVYNPWKEASRRTTDQSGQFMQQWLFVIRAGLDQPGSGEHNLLFFLNIIQY